MSGLVFHEENHTYELDGVTVPSVTEICKPLTADIAANAKPWLRDAAAAKGTAIHELCAEIDIQGNADDTSIPLQYSGYVTAYLKFLRDYQISSWLAVELPIASKSIGVAGTVDRIGMVDAITTFVDIKTGSKIDKAILTAQLNGYLETTLQPDCNYNHLIASTKFNLWGLQLMKNGKYRIYKCESSPIFDILLQLHIERKRIYGK